MASSDGACEQQCGLDPQLLPNEVGMDYAACLQSGTAAAKCQDAANEGAAECDMAYDDCLQYCLNQGDDC